MVNFSLTLALGFNSAMAFESTESTISGYVQEPHAPVKKKKEPRRRGDCEYLPNVWTLNICEQNIFCYQTPEDVHLWLPTHKRSGQIKDRLVIQNQATQQTIIEQWDVSETTLAWPLAKMPLQSGITYRVGLKKGRDYSLVELVLYQIAAHLSTTEQIAAMRQQGCSRQAELLEKN